MINQKGGKQIKASTDLQMWARARSILTLWQLEKGDYNSGFPHQWSVDSGLKDRRRTANRAAKQSILLLCFFFPFFFFAEEWGRRSKNLWGWWLGEASLIFIYKYMIYCPYPYILNLGINWSCLCILSLWGSRSNSRVAVTSIFTSKHNTENNNKGKWRADRTYKAHN